MTELQTRTVKKNVSKFNEDVEATGSYAYTADRLSSRLANKRISESIAEAFDFKDKKVLDIGCGDGAYTVEFPSLGVKEVVGVDPADVAIESANIRARELGLDATVKFEVGNVYELGSLLEAGRFDCVVLRGVLHHLPDPALAIASLASFEGTVIVLEPNGNNPVLKLLEKFSRYHIEHEERSFSSNQITSWLTTVNFTVTSSKMLNLVPYFCPDWLARLTKLIEPLIERLPLVRNIACGQSIIVANKSAK
jgi:2-polyprenyl-3-methyl-5-hydroxy-6-metoxy-1,4-benzoquinol methylase